MKLECVVNRSLQTILDEDVEYVIRHHHPSLIVDPPENMKMGWGKNEKRGIQEGWKRRDEGMKGKEGKRSFITWGNNEADFELIIGGSALCAMILHNSSVLSRNCYRPMACAL